MHFLKKISYRGTVIAIETESSCGVFYSRTVFYVKNNFK